MTPEELKAIRERSGLSPVEFGRKLGWRGSDATIIRQLRFYESGERPIPARIVVLLMLQDQRRRRLLLSN